MIDLLKNIFGFAPSADFALLVKEGAQIIDVRSVAEYKSGHIKGSVNIPLDRLHQHLHQINKEKTIITCCASGMRSASAKNILLNNGFASVHNGGGWMGLQEKIR
jgi:rhodanese-related sulfurtransferase